MPCCGNGDKHCCWVNGSPCKHLQENTVPGRRWACGLRVKYGNWDDVIASSEYHKDIVPVWGNPYDPNNLNCKDWPNGTQGKNRFRCRMFPDICTPEIPS
jgi:hypothetical protein